MMSLPLKVLKLNAKSRAQQLVPHLGPRWCSVWGLRTEARRDTRALYERLYEAVISEKNEQLHLLGELPKTTFHKKVCFRGGLEENVKIRT